MKKIIIDGTFSGSRNNYAQIDLYRPNPNGYDLSKSNSSTFHQEINDLLPDTDYNLDISGYTAGTFTLKISGDIPQQINKTYTRKGFNPGFFIHTSK